jgi:hypothetical protein
MQHDITIVFLGFAKTNKHNWGGSLLGGYLKLPDLLWIIQAQFWVGYLFTS